MAYINGKKLLQVVQSIGGGGTSSQLLTTTTDATESSGTYTLALTYLSDTPNVDDYVLYVDNGVLSTLYQVSEVGETNATLTKIGDIGGGGGAGSQSYEHHIKFTANSNYFTIFITNDSNVAFTSATLKQWFIDNSLTGDFPSQWYQKIYGTINISGSNYMLIRVAIPNNSNYIKCLYLKHDGTTATSTSDITYISFTDIVYPA